MPLTPTNENLVDVDRFVRVLQEGPLKSHLASIEEITELAKKCNHTTLAVGKGFGETTEEREETFAAIGKARFLLHLLHKKRYDSAIAVWVLCGGLYALQQMGFPIKEIGHAVLSLITELTTLLHAIGTAGA